MFDKAYFDSAGLTNVHNKILTGQRLDAVDGMDLFNSPNLTAVAALAASVRFRMHGAIASYVVNRQINYTNICVNGCTFCAFRRDNADEPGAFALSKAEIIERIAEACNSGHGLDEMHMVGGCHPNLPLTWFEDLLREIGSRFPNLPFKAFTPVEIAHFAKMEKISPREVLLRLKNAGLRMLPGGGAEIFDVELRKELCPSKATAEDWLAISGEAHKLGIKTNCTMLFGHIESYEHRVDHLLRLRHQQDKTGGFTCFIPLPFLKHNNRLTLPKDRQGPGDGLDALRTIAVARLLLDNIPHIKAYWIMLGEKLAQTALWYGADDLDGTIVEERIGHMAGAKSSQGLTITELENMIRQSGFIPRRRNALFDSVNSKETAA